MFEFSLCLIKVHVIRAVLVFSAKACCKVVFRSANNPEDIHFIAYPTSVLMGFLNFIHITFQKISKSHIGAPLLLIQEYASLTRQMFQHRGASLREAW